MMEVDMGIGRSPNPEQAEKEGTAGLLMVTVSIQVRGNNSLVEVWPPWKSK